MSILTFGIFSFFWMQHLRLTIDATGRWNIENFHFGDIFELMDFFRVRPIPFDKGRKESLLLERYPNKDSPMDPPRRLTSQIIDRWRTNALDHLGRV